MAMRIASVDACPDPGYLVLICTHIIINYFSINVIPPPKKHAAQVLFAYCLDELRERIERQVSISFRRKFGFWPKQI